MTIWAGANSCTAVLWADEEKAHNCIGCDECLEKCPQQIPISSWLSVVDDVLRKKQAYVTSLQ